MSVKAIQAVWDDSAATGNDRLVLLAIADACDHDGTGCWKGKETLAAMARCSRSTVTDALRRLQELGELVVEQRPGNTSLYRVVLPSLGGSAESRPGGEAGSAGGSADGSADGRPTGQPRSVPEPSIDPSNSGAALVERANQIKTKAEQTNEAARVLLNEWWERFTPRPTQNYPGAVQIVAKKLRAGWTREAVRAALRGIEPNLTDGRLEMHLRRNASRSSGLTNEERYAR